MVDHSTDFFKLIDNFAKTVHIPSISIFEAKLDFVPKVTIVIPTYKRPELLKEAIESALNQEDFKDYDVIVVDNNPERGCETEKLMISYNNPKLSYYKNIKNIGMFGNWNRCIELAKGEWICMLHDDDLLAPVYFKDFYSLILNRPKIGFISCRLKLLIQNQNPAKYRTKFQNIKQKTRILLDNLLPKYTKIKASDYLYAFNTYVVGSCFKRELAIKSGGFDSAFFPSSDYYFVVNFQREFDNVYYLRKKNYIYRILNNESSNVDTFKKFITNDFHFTNSLIRIQKLHFTWLLYFLNKQNVIQRVASGSHLYGVNLKVDLFLKDLNISDLHNYYPIRITGDLILNLISFYRSLVKF